MLVHRLVGQIRRSPRLKHAALRAYPMLLWLNHWRHRVRKTVDGITYELDLNQLIDSSIYFAGGFEAQASRKLHELVRNGSTAFDVGANIGSHTLWLAKAVGSTGRVVAFEPMQWAFEKLRRNVGLNSDLQQRVTLENLIVAECSQEAAKATFKTSWPLYGPPTPVAEEHVAAVSLDDYISRYNLSIHFLKIDVDGYELNVLRGAEKSLRMHRPLIMVEIGQYAHYEPRDIVDLLEAYGYRRFYWERESTPVDLNAIEHLLSHLDTINVFCSTVELSFGRTNSVHK